MTGAAQSEVATLRRVLLKRPREAWGGQPRVDRQWRGLGYLEPPDFDRAVEEFEAFAARLADLGVETLFLPSDRGTGLDSIYVRDAAVVCAAGVILGSMGKEARRGEPAALGEALGTLGVPVLGAVTGGARLEGGDVVWLDERSVAVGHGYRTDGEGIRQLERLLEGRAGEVLEVPLPHWRGPDDVFHLMSILSPIDRDLALVYSPLMPVPFRRHLLSRRIRLLEVPDDELETLGANVLAVAPRRCVMAAGSPRTRELLRRAGAEVHEFDGAEICRKGGGGPTCLTRPLERGP